MNRASAAESRHIPLRETNFGLRIAVICAMLGTFMQVLDQTIANVALPYMQGGLQASRDEITWVLTSYVIAAAIMTAPIGWFATRFGKKNFFIVTLLGFTVTSMMCGAAQTLQEIILFRLLQGAFGAALSPLSQAIVLDRYPHEKRGPIMSIWGLVVMMGPILGPTLGGYLTDFYSWRWVFYVNVPFGILATIGIWLCLDDRDQKRSDVFDWLGFGFLAVGLGALQLMLDRGTTQDWFDSTEIIIETVIAGLGIYLFLVHYFTADRNFIPRTLFLDRYFVPAVFVTFMISIVMLATSALLPPYLQNLGGYSVTSTGLLLAPRGAGTMISMFVLGRIVMRIDLRVPIGLGFAILLWSMWVMSNWTPDVPAADLISVSFIQGIGMGMIFIPSNIMAFSTLPGPLRTDGTAFLNLVRNVGAAIGVSVSSTVLQNETQIMHADLASHVNMFNRSLGFNAPSMLWNPQITFGLQQLETVVQRNAEIIAYSDVFRFMFYVSLPSILIVMLIRKPPRISKQQSEDIEIVEA
ncbi:MAG TPA: DHA2 family efflux MFS transporter permease subunit [Rhizomicrobium sp.]|nr:DHA2 family efflux MFS transporter permease subunit [Rhizomicrobium sp.]